MRIVVAGGTGFLGRALSAALAADGHEVIVLTRSAPEGVSKPDPAGGATRTGWKPDGQAGPWTSALEGAGAVVNLAGESIAARRWTAAQKQRIRDSRVLSTRSLVDALRAASRRPAMLVNASAVGYYGPRGDEPVTEEMPPGSDFLATLAVEWEAEAQRAAETGARVALVRSGVVLERDGGALPQMALPFKLFIGGRVGSGRQYMPWIHREDWISLVRWILATPEASGAFNATGPSPVTNADFAKALGRALRRPSFMPAPGFALRLALGEMADALLLSGQRALPVRASAMGFQFRYRTLDEALHSIYRRP